jgi:hypothetical protein
LELHIELEGRKIWRDKRFRNIDAEMGVRMIVGCKNKKQ